MLIFIYFSNDYEHKQSNYPTGKELVIYGEIVEYSKNTWNGYNTFTVAHRYIEIK